ncbi:MAG: hypothetical protein Q4D29_06155 [Lachnospiraceae bacterium]|nr:hypothetical protein [Lachnospiraceae bacterium]
MQIKCEYCGSYIDEHDEFCKQCGAVNANFKRSTDGTPKTITELKIWYENRNLPPKEVTRFFIGEDYKGPRAFGIYEQNGEFIVYKNKDDGTRAERYRGKDEAYAVNEIYLKLKSEILNQKAHNLNNKNGYGGATSANQNDKVFSIGRIALPIFFFLVVGINIIAFVGSSIKRAKDAPYAGNYYKYEDHIYYCNSYVDDDWYWYDDYSRDYLPVNIPAEMYNDIQNYKFSEYDKWDSSIVKFEDSSTGHYVETINDSSDSDYSWDSSDSWDSDFSDWDSDW